MVADRERYAMSYFQGLGYKPWQAAGIVGNLIQESSLNTGARNPGDGRDGSDSIGIGQWNGDRARALRRFAGSRGKDVTDFDTQLAFVEHELGGSESRAGRALRSSTDVHGATAAMIGFERPAGWSLDNPTGGHGWGNRFGHARRLSGMGGSPLVDAVAERGTGQRTLAGDAGNDRLEPQAAGGTPAPAGSNSPTVDIGLPPDLESKGELYDALVKRGMDMGSNARNIYDAIGGLAQVWAGTSEKKKLGEMEAQGLVPIVANMDPEYRAAAQLLGGRDGVAKAYLAQMDARTAAANRAEQRADRLETRDYERGRDAKADARADRAEERATAAAANDGVPSGYRWSADRAEYEPIPGGPADPAVKAGNGFRTLTPDEVTQRGLPAGQYQEGPDKRLYPISDGKGTTINLPSQPNIGTIPQGFEAIQDPNTKAWSMRRIPGGPEDDAKANAKIADNRAVSTDVITTAADRARDALGADGLPATGTMGRMMSSLPESNAAELRRQVAVLQANAKVENLTAMRQASPTGAALGAVSDSENAMLAAKSGSLDPDSPTFGRDLDDYERTMLRIVHGASAGDAIFEQRRAGGSAGAPPAPSAAPPVGRPNIVPGSDAASIAPVAPMLPEGVTEEDIRHTMQVHGLSREQVLERIR